MSRSAEASQLAASMSALQVSDASAAAAAQAADADEERSLSLPAHFYRAQARYNGLLVNGTLPRTPAACAELQRSLMHLQARIESAGIFSRNESSADEISTPSLKLLMVPFFLGQLESSFPGDVASRANHVLAAAKAFDAFMRRLESYGLIHSEGEMDNFTRMNAELIAKLTAPSAASSGSLASASSRAAVAARPSGPRPDPNAVRTAKIARMRRSKELGAQLEVLQQSRATSFKQRKAAALKAGTSGTMIASSSSASAQDDDEATDELLDAGSDEEDVRAFYLLLLQQIVLAAVDSTRSALDEADMLIHYRDVEARKPKNEQLANLSPEERARQAGGGGAGGAPAAKPTMYKMTPASLNEPIPSHMKHLLQNVAQPASSSSSSSSSAAAQPSYRVSSVATSIDALIDQRAAARENVFALTNQPTMSIEQWADAEIAAGRMPGPADPRSQPRQPDPRRIRSAADRDTAEEMVAAWQATHEDSTELGHEDGAAGAEKDEMKSLKDREWDNWKDDHQKGVGNSIK